jgi:cytochrome c-type biogenesis protein CcmH/NrfG
MSLAVELEEEKTRRSRAEAELHELRMMKDNLGRVSRLVATEMTALREQCQHEKEEAQRMKLEADEVMYGCHGIKRSVRSSRSVQAYLSTQLEGQVTPHHL